MKEHIIARRVCQFPRCRSDGDHHLDLAETHSRHLVVARQLAIGALQGKEALVAVWRRHIRPELAIEQGLVRPTFQPDALIGSALGQHRVGVARQGLHVGRQHAQGVVVAALPRCVLGLERRRIGGLARERPRPGRWSPALRHCLPETRADSCASPYPGAHARANARHGTNRYRRSPLAQAHSPCFRAATLT